MTCLDAGQIARAATLGTDDAHLAECLDCRRRLEADRAVGAALRGLAVPRLSAAHRKELAAEIIAAAEHVPARRHRWKLAVAAVALAASVALVAWRPRPTEPVAAGAPAFGSDEPIALSSASVARIESPPALAPPALDASEGAILEHATGTERDVVTLVDGALALDTRFARGVDVKIGDAIVRVDDAAVKIRAHRRAIVSVRVVVGAARIHSADQRVTLQRDSLWLPGPSAPQRSLAAFRDAWIELRAGRNREAMELFDRATDPVVLEEASYWAAIAARRSGDASLARERLAKFLREFPRSAYAAELQDEQR